MPSLLAVLLSTVLLVPAVSGDGGKPLAPAPLGPTAFAPQRPLVAFAGDRSLTVWVESLEYGGARILGAFSDREGRPLSPSAFVISPVVTLPPSQLLGTGNSFTLFIPSYDDAATMLEIDLAGHVVATRRVAI